MPKSRDFNCSFDVKHVFIAQFISKLQAKTSKIDILIFHNFVKKNSSKCCELISISISKWHKESSQTLRLKNILLNFTNCILKKAMVTPIISGNAKKAKAERNWPWYCNPNVEHQLASDEGVKSGNES